MSRTSNEKSLSIFGYITNVSEFGYWSSVLMGVGVYLLNSSPICSFIYARANALADTLLLHNKSMNKSELIPDKG